jgi:hypothetical protein
MTDHLFQVRYSRDAHNFTAWRDLNAGATGAFGKQLTTRQLGQALWRAWETCDTSAFAADLYGAGILVDGSSLWQDFPLPDGSYDDQTREWTQQDVVNYLPLFAQQAGTRSRTLYRTAPGLDVFASIGNGPHRGAISVEGTLFVVSGTSLYEVARDGTATSRGTIPGTGRVCMAYNQITSGNQLVVGNGSSGYVYNTVSGAFTQITDDGFVGFIACDFLNQYIVGVEPLRRFWYHSELADALSFNTLDRYGAETAPDPIMGLIASHNEVLVFGARTIEPWVNEQESNAAATAFQLQRGSVIERGCASGATIRRLDNSVFFLGDDRIVYRLNGYTPLPISTQPMAAAFRDLDPTKAFAFTFEDNGHVVYYLTWGDGQTWGYDVASQKWHRRESFGLNRWRINTLVKWGNEWVGGDFQNGKLYRIAWGYPYEGCEIMPRRLRTSVLHGNGNPVTVNGFRVEAATGRPVSALGASIPPSISGALPDATAGDVIDYHYTVTPAYPGQNVTLTISGDFPPGLSLDSTGHVTGTLPVDSPGLYTFTITPSSECADGTALSEVVTVSDNIASAILTDAPILYWKLHETSGATVTDYSGYGRNGTITGSPTQSSSGITLTALAQGVYYPGNVAGSVLDVGSDDTWAIEAVITRASVGGSVWEHIAGQWRSPNLGYTNSLLALAGNSTPADRGKPFGGFHDSIAPTNFYTVQGTAAPSARTHLMIVREPGISGSGVLRMYKDGVLVASNLVGFTASKVGIVSDGAKFLVGSDTDAASYFPASYGFLGTIEHVAVYNTTITAARALYHAQMLGLA